MNDVNVSLKSLEIFTCQQIVPELYSSSSKVIISTHDQAILLNLNISQQIQVYEFNCDREPATIASLAKSHNASIDSSVAMTLTPNFCLGLVAFSEAGKVELTKLVDWWSQRGLKHSIPDLIKLDGKQAKVELQREFWQQMYLQMEQQNNATALRIATLQKQYLGLRQLHEDMQNAFATVEGYLSKAKLPPIQLVFDTQITDKSVEPAQVNDSNSLTLTQLLPLSSRGLAAIELHIAQQDVKAQGDLQISVKACEDKTAIAVWRIPYQHLSPWLVKLRLAPYQPG